MVSHGGTLLVPQTSIFNSASYLGVLVNPLTGLPLPLPDDLLLQVVAVRPTPHPQKLYGLSSEYLEFQRTIFLGYPRVIFRLARCYIFSSQVLYGLLTILQFQPYLGAQDPTQQVW